MKTHIASMAVNPLEGLMSVNQRLVWSSTAEPQRQLSRVESSPASLHQPRQRTRSGHQPRPWECGSNPISGPGSGIVVQSRTPRSQNTPENAARERSRVRNLRQAFHSLQAALPSVPADTKLSKLDVLLLAADYIAHLTNTLQRGGVLVEPSLNSRPGGYLHPVKKWPMRSLLYCGSVGELLSGNPMPPTGQDGMKKQEADNSDSRIM